MLDEGFGIEVYSKPDCPWCVKAKEWLSARGIPYREISVEDRDDREKLYDGWGLSGGGRTMPQVFIVDVESDDRTRIGGYDRLAVSALA